MEAMLLSLSILLLFVAAYVFMVDQLSNNNKN